MSEPIQPDPYSPAPDGTDLSPARLEAAWISTTVDTRTRLELGDTQSVRAFIEETDTNLRGFADGGYAPDSDELYGIYIDAVTRSAIPYGEPPMTVTQVREQLSYVGLSVPAFDADDVARRTGIMALTPATVARSLDTATTSSTPAAEAAQTEQRATAQPTEDAGVTIYTTPNCPGCMATKRALDKSGIDYNQIDLSQRPDLVQAFKAQGLARAPIVEADGERWSGYNPDKMKEHGLRGRPDQRGTNPSSRDSGHSR